MTEDQVTAYNKKHGIVTKGGRPIGSTKQAIEAKRLLNQKRQPFESGTIVLGMMEYKGRAVLKKIGHSRKSIHRKIVVPHLKNHINNQSTLITDYHSVYDETHLFVNKHLRVNHDLGYVIDGIHINGIENLWMHLKKFISGTYFHVSKQHFDKYLDEFTFRWNRRNESDQVLIDDFILLGAKNETRKTLANDNREAA